MSRCSPTVSWLMPESTAQNVTRRSLRNCSYTCCTCGSSDTTDGTNLPRTPAPPPVRATPWTKSNLPPSARARRSPPERQPHDPARPPSFAALLHGAQQPSPPTPPRQPLPPPGSLCPVKLLAAPRQTARRE